MGVLLLPDLREIWRQVGARQKIFDMMGPLSIQEFFVSFLLKSVFSTILTLKLDNFYWISHATLFNSLKTHFMYLQRRPDGELYLFNVFAVGSLSGSMNFTSISKCQIPQTP